MDRAVSTVLDVTLCLILIGVAVGTLVAAVPGSDRTAPVDGDPNAAAIGTVTASVSLEEGRTAHGTLAQHLSRATVIGAALDDEGVIVSEYPDATRAAVGNHTGDRVKITTRWTAYPDSPLEGRLTVGPSPPSNADVAVTRLSVDSGIPDPEPTRSTEAFASSVATGYIDRVFPPERTRVLLTNPRTAPSAADRYRDSAETIGIEIGDPIANARPHETNERLASGLAGRFETDLRAGNGTETDLPTATADRVEIVIRRWEP